MLMQKIPDCHRCRKGPARQQTDLLRLYLTGPYLKRIVDRGSKLVRLIEAGSFLGCLALPHLLLGQQVSKVVFVDIGYVLDRLSAYLLGCY